MPGAFAATRLEAMLRVDAIENLAAAEALAPEWDRLAVARSLPMAAPAWGLAWWRHLAPPRASLRILAIRDRAELIALAPWFAQHQESGRVDLRFLGAEASDRVDILSVPGREREVAAVLRATVRRLRPRPDVIAFEAVAGDSPWRRALAAGLRGRARFAAYRSSARPAPAVTLPGGAPEAWLASRSRNFRGQMGRLRRRLEASGGAVRQIVDPAEVPGTLAVLLSLHASRWQGRDESSLLRDGVGELLADAATALGPERLRLWTAEIDGQPISAQLFLAAGGQLKYWNGGWSEAHAALKPSMLTILAALEDGIARGERRLDLGVGDHPYKLRFADLQDTVTWGGLVVRNPRWPRSAAELAPIVLRHRAKRLLASLPAPLAERVRPRTGAANT
jgi:CelD/BcsL family acetyltransferase involved in cellulose biosynthesis